MHVLRIFLPVDVNVCFGISLLHKGVLISSLSYVFPLQNETYGQNQMMHDSYSFLTIRSVLCLCIKESLDGLEYAIEDNLCGIPINMS